MTRRLVTRGEVASIGLVGPHLGRHPGWVVSQGEILAEHFAAEGHRVRLTSSRLHPLARLLETSLSLVSWIAGIGGPAIDVVIIAVFSGRAFRAAELASRLVATFRRSRLVLHLHGGGLPELFAADPARVRAVLASADAIVTPSEYLARATRDLERGGDLGAPIVTIPNVFDLDARAFTPRDGVPASPRILWMRTFHEIYRPELAIDALAALRSRGIDARLTLAGQDKGLLQPCRQRVAELGLVDLVEFPGFLDAEAKRRAFTEHDVFWNTNRVDNAPVTVLEALASGLPVVATRVGGVPDLLRVDGRTAGVVVSGSDPEVLAAGFADATADLVADPASAARLSALGRKVAEASAWPNVYRRWLDLFAVLDLVADDVGSGR